MKKILLVDDDPHALESTSRILELKAYEVVKVTDAREALFRLLAKNEASDFDLVISDIRMPGMSGIEMIKSLRAHSIAIPFILMTAYGSIEEAVWAMKMGAVDFLTKPFKRDELLECVKSVSCPKGPNDSNHSDFELIGQSHLIQNLKRVIAQVSATDAHVLVVGESGTGKERVARLIHESSSRKIHPFIAINCAAIPDHLLESELFGHEKGSFSGATSLKKGLFESADGGTLFLDEIGDMPLALQGKLLRAIQEGETRRVGATESKKFNVRILAATHRNLDASVEKGLFRHDLLFRIDVIRVVVPPLRERREDIGILIQHFLNGHSKTHHREDLKIAPSALTVLENHSWPGNVRELSNLMERIAVLCPSNLIQAEDLPQYFGQDSLPNLKEISIRLGTPLNEVEDLLIRKTLELTHGDKQLTAKLLGINSRTIYRKLEKSGREDPSPS